MYKARFINPLKQFGKQNYELILTDDEGVLPPIRQWCKFSDKVTDDELIEFADSYIKQYLNERADALSVKPSEEKTDIDILQEEKIAEAKLVTIVDCKLDKPLLGTVDVTKKIIDGEAIG